MVEFHLQDLFVTGIAPAILRAQQEVNKALAQMPHANLRTPEGLATLRASTAPPQAAPVLKPTDLAMRGPGGDIRLHVFTPQAPTKAVFLRIHGGGWLSGAPEDDEALNDQIARNCGVVVISPEYRLAPEVTVREQIDDCVAVAQWMGTQAERRFGSTAVLLGGCSAGSHLAAATLLRLRDARDRVFPRVAGIHLDCGLYDLSGSPSVRAADDRALILTPDWILSFFELGLPGLTAEARRDPSVSPLYADLAGLPPALFTVGALDPLRDDALFLSARWQAAGSSASVDVWPEGAHAFTNMGTPLAALALERTTSWLTSALARANART
jgi:acetyl esterase